MSGTQDDRNLECLVCELVEDIENEDDKPVLHQVVATDETATDIEPAGPFICDQCLDLLIEWKHERNVMVLADESLDDEIVQDLESAMNEVAETHDGVWHDGQTKNARTAGDD